MVKEVIDLPDTEALKQIVEVLVNKEWIDVKDSDKLSWKKLYYGGNKTGIRLSFNNNLVRKIRFICAECGEIKQITVREIKDVFYCSKCATRRYWYFDKAPENEREEITDYKITRVHVVKDNQWYNVTNKDIKVKTFELKKGYLCRHLIYNGLICDEIEFLCKNCNKICHTTWGKATKKKFSALCQHCATTSEENKKKVAETTKKAMNTPEMYAKMCKIRKQQWKDHPEWKQKSSERMKKILKERPEVKQKIVDNTKKAMHSSKVVNKTMLGMRASLLKKPLNVQKKVTEYIRSVITNYTEDTFINCIEEYPILICHEDITYALIDICFPQRKIAIEVLGDYWHNGWIEHLKENSSVDELLKKYSTDEKTIIKLKSDVVRHKTLTDLGWTILYITETEINNSYYKAIIDKFIADNELWKYPLSDADKVYLEDDFLEKLLKE